MRHRTHTPPEWADTADEQIAHGRDVDDALAERADQVAEARAEEPRRSS